MREAPPVRLPEPRCLLILAAWCPVQCHPPHSPGLGSGGCVTNTKALRRAAGHHIGVQTLHVISPLQKSVIPVWHQPFLSQERWFEAWEGK